MQVAFNIMLPCMLFTKVAATLATNFQCSMFVVPVLALFQVILFLPTLTTQLFKSEELPCWY
jgi:predicted permease